MKLSEAGALTGKTASASCHSRPLFHHNEPAVKIVQIHVNHNYMNRTQNVLATKGYILLGLYTYKCI